MRRAARQTKSAFREGFDARMAGKSTLDCPYRGFPGAGPDMARTDWFAGWRAADEQLEKQGAKQ